MRVMKGFSLGCLIGKMGALIINGKREERKEAPAMVGSHGGLSGDSCGLARD